MEDGNINVGEICVNVENTKETETDNKQVGPKIKIGTGKPKRAKHSKKKEDSESDMPHYSMRI